MDLFAHLFLAGLIFGYMRVLGLKAGIPELAAIVAGAVLPDAWWFSGLTEYRAAHIATHYLLAAAPFLLFARTRLAAAGFGIAAALHVLIDAPIHTGSWQPFWPLGLTINGAVDYWLDYRVVAAYWGALLALLLLLLFMGQRGKNPKH